MHLLKNLFSRFFRKDIAVSDASTAAPLGNALHALNQECAALGEKLAELKDAMQHLREATTLLEDANQRRTASRDVILIKSLDLN